MSVTQKTPTVFYTVGDNQLLSAGPYEKKQLLEKMVAMKSNGRYLESNQPFLRIFGSVWLLRRRLLLIIRAVAMTILRKR